MERASQRDTAARLPAAVGPRLEQCGVPAPRTPLLLSRARFCIAASHTAEDLDFALKMVEEAAIEVGVLYDRRPAHKAIASGAELDVEAKTRQKELRGASMEAQIFSGW